VPRENSVTLRDEDGELLARLQSALLRALWVISLVNQDVSIRTVDGARAVSGSVCTDVTHPVCGPGSPPRCR
jgi:hypothetical protein